MKYQGFFNNYPPVEVVEISNAGLSAIIRTEEVSTLLSTELIAYAGTDT